MRRPSFLEPGDLLRQTFSPRRSPLPKASQTLCGTRAERQVVRKCSVVFLNHETYLVRNEIEEEQRHPKIVREEGDRRAGLTYRADGDVEFACQNKDDDDQPEPMRPWR